MATLTKPLPRRAPTKEEAIRTSIVDPVEFCESWLGVKLWWKQKVILKDIFSKRKVNVRACHASSKTFTAALAVLAFLARYKEVIVITTAPTQNQVEKLLWAEIRALVAQSRYPFPEPTLTQLRIPGPKKREAFGFTTSVDTASEGVRFQGFHAAVVVVILDEAPGIPAKIWDAVEGILASGDIHVLTLGNPTIASGHFYDSFSTTRESWCPHSISCFDTPNFEGICLRHEQRTIDALGKEVVKTIVYGDPKGKDLRELTEAELDYNPLPYLISRRWVFDRLNEWGIESPLFQSRCLGDFATQAPDSLYSLQWLDDARKRAYVPGERDRVYGGLDVAGPGEDETCLCLRQGPHIIGVWAWPDPDPRGEIIAILAEYRDVLANLNVDCCGIGYYLARYLEDEGFNVSDVNVTWESRDPEKFFKLKGEMYWGFRDRLKSGDISGLLDEKASAQLSGIRWKHNARGQVQIESKEEAAKRGVKSPDRAEGVILAYAPPMMHGLIQWYEQQAIKNKQNEHIPSTITSLDSAQKADIFPKKVEKLTRKGPKAPECITECPDCGNKFLSQYGEGAWRCSCGASGVGLEKLVTV